MEIGLIGAGLQGKRRAYALNRFEESHLKIVADSNIENAQTLARELHCLATADWRDIIARDDIQSVIICAPTYLHASMSIASMERGKHVFCEKPLAITVVEAEDMIRVAQDKKVILKYGCNYRYHRAIQQARELLDNGTIGQLNYFRCRHGICGRPCYEDEWRVKKELSGGGHLIEQGVHIVDLFRWFIGEPVSVFGKTATYFWSIEPSEDNAFVLLTTADNKTGFIHSSLTQWKNLFSLEIFGQDGYLEIDGLGGSYGTERLIIGRRAFLKPFHEEIIEYRGVDNSLSDEWQEFINAITKHREPSESGEDGLKALRIILAIYDSASQGQVVKLN